MSSVGPRWMSPTATRETPIQEAATWNKHQVCFLLYLSSVIIYLEHVLKHCGKSGCSGGAQQPQFKSGEETTAVDIELPNLDT